MTLARQRTRTLRAIRQGNATLFLNIHRPLRLRGLRLRLILLLLLLRLLAVVILVSLALLALLGPIFHPLRCTLLRALLSFHRVITRIHFVTYIIFFTRLGAIRRVTGFFLLPCLLLLRFQTAANVFRSARFEDWPLAMFTNDCFEELVVTKFASRESRGDLVVKSGQR